MLVEEMQDAFFDSWQILKPGHYSGDVGFLMLSVLGNVLRVPVVLLTSIENFPVTLVFPKDGLVSSNSIIYLAFIGPGS